MTMDSYAVNHTIGMILSKSMAIIWNVWEWIFWSSIKVYDMMEFGGEVLADFLGLTTSKYQWILDYKERQDEERQLRLLELKQLRQMRLETQLIQERKRLDTLEAGSTI